MNPEQGHLPPGWGRKRREDQGRVSRFNFPHTRESPFGKDQGSFSKKSEEDMNANVHKDMMEIFGSYRRSRKNASGKQETVEINEPVFGRKVKPAKETSLRHQLRGTFGPSLYSEPGSLKEKSPEKKEPLKATISEPPVKRDPKKEDFKFRFSNLFGKQREIKDSPQASQRTEGRSTIFKERQKQDIKTRLMSFLPESLRKKREASLLTKTIPEKPVTKSGFLQPFTKEPGAVFEGDTITSAKQTSRARTLSPFARKFLTKKSQTHQFQDLERLVVERAREADLEEGRFNQLTDIGDIVTQSCRSESYRMKMENKESVRLNATSITIPSSDPLRREEDKYGKKRTFLVHQGQHLLLADLKYPFEIEQALSNFVDCQPHCGILGDAGIAYFIFNSKVILWSYLAATIERQSAFNQNNVEGDYGKVLVSKERTSSIQIIDCEFEAVSVALINLTSSAQSKLTSEYRSQGTRTSLKHKLQEPPFLVVITTLQLCHFFKVISLSPKLSLELVRGQECSSQNERIQNITPLPNGRVLASCIWGQLCELELKDLVNLNSFPEESGGKFYPPHRRPSFREEGINAMTAKKNLESSMVGDLFRRISRFHAQRQVIQLAPDHSRFFVWTVVRSRPIASPQVRVYDLGQIGTDLNHAVTITSRDIKRKLRQLERKTRGMVREREPLHFGSPFDIAGVVPLSKAHSELAHAIIVMRSGLQIYIKLKTCLEFRQLVEQEKCSSRYVSFFKSLLPWRRNNEFDHTKFMREKGWAQEAYERIKGSTYEVTTLIYPPNNLSVEQVQNQELSSNGLATRNEIHTKYECSNGSPIAHIYKVIPTKRGFMVEALLSQQQEEMQANRSKSMPPSNYLQKDHYKRAVIEFGVDDLNFSRLHLAPSSHNQKNYVAKYIPGVEKSQMVSFIHDGSAELLAVAQNKLGMLALSIDLPQNLEEKSDLRRDHLLQQGTMDEELDYSPIHGQPSVYSVLTKNSMKLFIKRRPIDLVAQTLQKLAIGEAIQEEIDALIEAYGHVEFAALLLAVLINGSHSLYFLQTSKAKHQHKSASVSRRILDWEKETILKSVIYDARPTDISRLSSLVRSATGSYESLPCVGQVLTKPVLEIIRKLFFKILQGAPRVEGSINPNNQANKLGFQKERTPANPQTEALVLVLSWLVKPIWLQNVFKFHPTLIEDAFTFQIEIMEVILPKLAILRQFFLSNSLKFGMTESTPKPQHAGNMIEFNLTNNLTSSLLSFMDYIFQGLDLLHQIAVVSGPQNLGLYVFRRLPLQIVNEYKSLDFMMYLTSKQGRQFAKQLVSAQLADELCWREQGSDSWVQKLGLRCPFVFSHSIILVEKLHAYVLYIRRRYERQDEKDPPMKQDPSDLRNLARRCLIHVDIAYTVWNLLETNNPQYLETALHIIIDALLLEKFRCIHAQGYKGTRTFLTAALQSNQKRKQKVDLFNDWVTQMSLKFLKHPPLDSSGSLMHPNIQLQVPLLPTLETILQDGQNPRLFQIIEILSTYYLLLKEAALSKQQNNPRQLKMLGGFTLNELNDLRRKLIQLTVNRTPEIPALHIHLFRLTSFDLRLPLDALSLADSVEVKEEVIQETKSLRTVHPGRATFLAQFLKEADQIEALCIYCLGMAQQDQTLRGLQTFYQIPIDRVILLEQRIQIMTLTVNALQNKLSLTSIEERVEQNLLIKEWSHSKKKLGIKDEESKHLIGDSKKTTTHREVEGILAFLQMQMIVHEALVTQHNILPSKSPHKEEAAKIIEVLDRRPAENLQELIELLQQFKLFDAIIQVILTRFQAKPVLPMSLELEDQLTKDLEISYSRYISKVYAQFPKNPASRLLPRLRELKILNNNKLNNLFPPKTILFNIELESLRGMSLSPSLTSEDIFTRLIRKSSPQKEFWAIELFLTETKYWSKIIEILMLLPQIYRQIESREKIKDNPKPRMCLMGKKVLMSHLLIGCVENESILFKEKIEAEVEKVIQELEDDRLKIMVSPKSIKEMESTQTKLIDALDHMNRRFELSMYRSLR